MSMRNIFKVRFCALILCVIALTLPARAQPQIGATTDWQVIEAETLANGKSWISRPHTPNWYSGIPNNNSYLTGAPAVKAAENQPASATFHIKNSGTHLLWLRFLYTGANRKGGAFTVTLQQNGRTVAERTIESGDEAFRSPNKAVHMYWTWASLKADLATGDATVQLSRPNTGTTWLARNIDLLLLTNLTGYQPNITDLQPQIYVRWTNTGSGEPYCLYGFVHRNARPSYARPGMLTKAGFDRSIRVPKDKSQWIGPGESSAWGNLSPFLLPNGDYNRVTLTATRDRHASGFVDGRIQGTLEFAIGEDKKIIRTVRIDQDAPLIRVEVPGDFSKPDAKIQTPWDFVQQEQNALPPLKPGEKPAKYLDLVTILNLTRGSDDPKLIEAEMQNLSRLGFNGTYYAKIDPAHPETTVDFYRAHGMQTRFGVGGGFWNKRLKEDKTQLDLAEIAADYQEMAKEDATFLPDVTRQKLADEPGASSIDELAKSPASIQQFHQFLQERKVLLADIGAAGWDQVIPTSDKTKPVLFYYSALFRLQAAADLAREIVAIKKKYFPDSVKTHVNYSPPYSWVSRGVDPFLMQRDGGLEMGLTEDWLGYSASPEYTSDTYALLRAAGQGQPLGGIMVAKSGNALMQRIKYYTMIAGGARTTIVYNYGPNYAGIDSWSEKYDVYPVIRDVQFELGHIDQALQGTTRRKADIAILYNRTAAIWSGDDSSAEQDARYIRWALSHAGYDADIIPEEDIVAGKLDQYKVLYIDGIQLRNDVAQKIADWVKNGGVLFGGAGAATRDEFNKSQSTLESTFGAKSVNLQTVNAAGRPKYELRTQKILDTLQSVNAQNQTQFDQLCYSETLQPEADAKVLFKDKTGTVMGTENSIGKGTAIRLAALPGLAYLNHATRDKDYDADTYLPQNYDAAQRDFLSLPARLAKVEKVAESNLDIPEITRYDAPGRSVIFVVNYAGKVKGDFSMLVPDANWATKAYCADGAKVLLTKAANGMIKISFPLNVAGAVVLEK
jgi:hypothetical protein